MLKSYSIVKLVIKFKRQHTSIFKEEPSHSDGRGSPSVNQRNTFSATNGRDSMLPPGATFNHWKWGSLLNHINWFCANCLQVHKSRTKSKIGQILLIFHTHRYIIHTIKVGLNEPCARLVTLQEAQERFLHFFFRYLHRHRFTRYMYTCKYRMQCTVDREIFVAEKFSPITFNVKN